MTSVKYIYFTLLYAVITFSSISDGYSQAGLTVLYGTVMDGNTFRNYENISDIIHQPQFSLFYDHASEKARVRFFYNGSAFLFDEFTSRQYFYHNIGITGSWRTDTAAPLLSWGIQGSRRFNQNDYNYYNYDFAQGYLNFRFDKSQNREWVLGMQLNYRQYKELPEFSFLESAGFVRLSLFLKTRTTVMARIQAGYKQYAEAAADYEYIEDMDWTEKGSRGRGRGKGDNQDNQDVEYDRTVQVASEGSGVLQLSGSLRIAQSVAAKTGVALEAAVQRNPAGGSRVLSGQDSGYETNDELFDDPYSYDMEEVSLELTQILPWSSSLKLGGSYTFKRYDRPVYDLEGNILEGTVRKDTLPAVWASLEKTFSIKGVTRSMQVYIHYLYLNNDSNDAYYSYTNSITSVGCSITI